MSTPQSIDLIKWTTALRSLRSNIQVSTKFSTQMQQIDRLLKNDKTGLVSTVLDFMVSASTVPMNIETKNTNFDNNLKIWQTKELNKNVAKDIPRGLRELSVQYFKERYRSSFLILNIRWGTVDFGETGSFEVPTRMWFTNGASVVEIKNPNNSLNNTQYFIKKSKTTDKQEIKDTPNTTVIIRKPFSAWHDIVPTPFLVSRGVLFNALVKQAIVTKQADVIESIIPYLLLLKSGSDKLAELDMLADEPEMKKLKEAIVKAKNEHDRTGALGDLIASLSHDVDIDHLLPDLLKVFDAKITQASDKNLLAGLGMIELEGFSKNRQETILNPKILVEEVKDGIKDWKSMLEEVMYQMLERNKSKHPKLANNVVRVVPGTIKAFLTDNMKTLLRSVYDRGLLAKQSFTEDVADADFETQVDRVEKEEERGLNDKMYPPIIQNFEQHLNDTTNNEEVLDDRNPNTPEADNFNNAILSNMHLKKPRKKKKKSDTKKSEEIVNAFPFETIDNLPENLKESLPIGAQLIWLKAFNDSIKDGKISEDNIISVWDKVEQKYKKNKKGKWVKK